MRSSTIFKSGEEHPNWNGGKPFCLDCKKVLDNYEAKRCRECWRKNKLSERAARNSCEDCGGERSRRSKYCKSCERLHRPRGEAANNWKGGKKNEAALLRGQLEYKVWRKAVFERDNYTCVFCLRHGGDLEADHIKPFAFFPELRLAIDNGRTLCKPCHRTTDTFGTGSVKLYGNIRNKK